MFDAQVESAVAQATLLTKGRLYRINKTAGAGDYSLDDARPEKIHQLINHGRAAAVMKANLDIVQERFLNGVKVSPFQPCG